MCDLCLFPTEVLCVTSVGNKHKSYIRLLLETRVQVLFLLPTEVLCVTCTLVSNRSLMYMFDV